MFGVWKIAMVEYFLEMALDVLVLGLGVGAQVKPEHVSIIFKDYPLYQLSTEDN